MICQARRPSLTFVDGQHGNGWCVVIAIIVGRTAGLILPLPDPSKELDTLLLPLRWLEPAGVTCGAFVPYRVEVGPSSSGCFGLLGIVTLAAKEEARVFWCKFTVPAIAQTPWVTEELYVLLGELHCLPCWCNPPGGASGTCSGGHGGLLAWLWPSERLCE